MSGRLACGMRAASDLALVRFTVVPLLLSATGAIAQAPTGSRIAFDLIGVNDGLPHAIVECFLEDQRGILWVGMQQGLAVYDGSTFVPVDLTEDGAPIGVRAMTQDHEGTIWVAAEQGPVRVDPVSRRADLLRIPDSLRSGIETMWFHAVAVTKPGEILFGANQGTYFLDTRTRTFRALRDAEGNIVKTFWRYLRADPARQGVWVSTHDQGLAFYHAPTGNLHVRGAAVAFSPLIGESMVSLCPDGHGGFWCSDRATGNICHWDGSGSTIRRWDHVPGDADMKVSRAWHLHRDSRGRIWGSAAQPGGFMFDPADSTAVAFPANAPTGGLPRGSLNDVYEGDNGELWVANYLGIAIHDPAQPQPRIYDLVDHDASPSAPRIWSMEFSGDSAVWCAMGEFGLVQVDLRTDEVRAVPFEGLTVAEPFAWDVLPQGDRIIVACSSDVLEWHARTRRWRKLIVLDEHGDLPKPGRRWLSGGRDGTVWMGLDLLKLAHFDPRTGESVMHVPDSTRKGALRYENTYCAVSMPDGRTWFGGNIYGLTYHDAKTGAWTDLRADVAEHRLRVGRIVGMAAASDSVLWLASDGAGLIRYHIPSGSYTHYDHRHGFTELGLYSVVIDGHGRVWTDSDERIFCFDPVTERAMVVDPNSSTGGDAAKWTLAISGSGLLAMNIGRELAVFDADEVGNAPIPPAPVLTRVHVDGTAIDAGPEGSIAMHYGDTLLELRYGAMLPPGRIQRYAMRINGGSWSESKEGVVNLRGIAPGQYVFELKVMNNEGRWGAVTTVQVRMDPPWWLTIWARIVFALLLAAVIVLIFRARLNWVRKRERAQEEQARQVNELKLQALRAQMDPHFIFNCLNSIDSFIIANDREQASHYLGRFAKLIRLILQHSDSTRVPLEREVEMLKYYLELEALRFKTPFTFEVTVDEELDGEPVELPTMLIQPYIENAIWHGLRHKEGPGHLRVSFALRNDQLECVVEDNGIGRDAAREINRARSGGHRSMGMRVSADRLKLYGELEQGASRVAITDLTYPDGTAAGTSVVIDIPIFGENNEE